MFTSKFTFSRPVPKLIFGAGAILTAFALGAVYASPTRVVRPDKSSGEIIRLLPEDMPEHVIRIFELTSKPGGIMGAHRHPGHTLLYIVSGNIETQVGDGPLTQYGAGDIIYEPPRALHATFRNLSETEPARSLVIFINKRGEDVLLPAGDDNDAGTHARD